MNAIRWRPRGHSGCGPGTSNPQHHPGKAGSQAPPRPAESEPRRGARDVLEQTHQGPRSMLTFQRHWPDVWCSPLRRPILAHVCVSTGTAIAGILGSCPRVCATTGSRDDDETCPPSTPLRFDREGQEIRFLSPSLTETPSGPRRYCRCIRETGALIPVLLLSFSHTGELAWPIELSHSAVGGHGPPTVQGTLRRDL